MNTRSTKVFSVVSRMTLREMGLDVLNTNEAHSKAFKTLKYVQAWKFSDFKQVSDSYSDSLKCPSEPARPVVVTNIEVDGSVPSKDAAYQQRIKRILKKNAIEYSIHGIANAESYAIDLFWDIIVRFNSYNLPLEFYEEMVYIVNQEAEHFLSWNKRLDELDCPFGSLPFYEGLWQSAHDTQDDLLARLAVINLTHEAKGLDSYQKTREKFVKSRDEESVAVLDNNYNEEIGHVRAGVKWFKFLCAQRGLEAVPEFHRLSRLYFKGKLKEPFNRPAREQAGLTEEWYMPLT